MARRTKVEAEKTRLRILKAALDLFSEEGYERTTFEDVAARIGMPKGAVYWHFKTKPDLLTALVAHMSQLHTARIGRDLPHPETLDGLVAHFVARAKLITSSPANRKYFLMMTRLDWPSAKFAPVKQRIRQLSTGPFAIMENTLLTLRDKRLIRPDTDVTAVTSILVVLWLGLIEHDIAACLEVGLPRAIEMGFRALLDTVAV
jgi:TetR/AcrR family acrAB operon transcriptional repressor